jgi:uncharacterized OB-fold protein
MMKTPNNTPLKNGAWHGDLPVTSRYTFGVAGERFYRAIKDEGKILGTECKKCQRIYVPAALFCERCLRELDAWVDVGTSGEIYTYTLLYEDLDGKRLDQPEMIAFIRLGDGGLVHRIGEIEPDQVEIGLQVEAVFKPETERRGSIEDISHFRASG